MNSFRTKIIIFRTKLHHVIVIRLVLPSILQIILHKNGQKVYKILKLFNLTLMTNVFALIAKYSSLKQLFKQLMTFVLCCTFSKLNFHSHGSISLIKYFKMCKISGILL